MTLPEGIIYPKMDDDTPEMDSKVSKSTNLKDFLGKEKMMN